MSRTPIDEKIQDLFSKKEFQQANALIEKRILESPNSADSYYLKGVAHYFQGQVGGTVENLKKALALDPRHTDAAICLSVLYNDIGKYEEAKSVFETANRSVLKKNIGGGDLEVDKKFAVKHLEIADLYLRYRRYDEAIEEYSKAALLDPTTLEIRIRRAKAYAKKGFVTRAVQELQTLKAENPTHTGILLQLGLLHYSQGNVLDAELEWEGVLDLSPNHPEALAYLDMAKRARVKSP